jgi:hypothetical protein
VGHGEVAVVIGRVPASEFGDDVLSAHLNDREWLERAVTEHQAVVQRLLPVATVVPLRFGSLHRDRAAVEAFLETHEEGFRSALELLRGRVEFGVKVWIAPPSADSRAKSSVTGREYLERRRKAREDAAAQRANIFERLRAIHERLLDSALAGVLNRPQPRELTGDAREMVMNAAYLVPAQGDALLTTIDVLRGEHPDLVLDVTGPWAAYNFVEGTAA